MKFLSGLLSLLLLAAAIIFAVSNRQDADLSLWPFNMRVTAPLYLLTLGSLVIGLAIGGIVAALTLLPHRHMSQTLRTDIAGLHTKLDDLQERLLRAGRIEIDQPENLPRRWQFWKRK